MPETDDWGGVSIAQQTASDDWGGVAVADGDDWGGVPVAETTEQTQEAAGGVSAGQYARLAPAGIAQAAGTAIAGLSRIAKFAPGAGDVGRIAEALKSSNPLDAAAQFGRDIADRAMADYGVKPETRQTLAGKVIEGAGSIVPILAAPPAALLTGGAMAGESARTEAEQAGGDQTQQAKAFVLNAITGAVTEKLLGVPALLKSAKAAASPVLESIGKQIAGQVAKGFGREGLQETLETFAQDVIAKHIAAYDEDRNVFDPTKLAETFLVGGIIGGPLGGVTQLAASLDARGKAQEASPEKIIKSIATEQPPSVEPVSPPEPAPLVPTQNAGLTVPDIQPFGAPPRASDVATMPESVGGEITSPIVGKVFVVQKRLRQKDASHDADVTVTRVTRREDTRGGSQMIEVHFSDGISTSRNAGLQSDGTTIPVEQAINEAINMRSAKEKQTAESAVNKTSSVAEATPQTPAPQAPATDALSPETVRAYAGKLPEARGKLVESVLIDGVPVEEAAATVGMAPSKAQEAVDKARQFIAQTPSAGKPLPAQRSYEDEPSAGRTDAVDLITAQEELPGGLKTDPELARVLGGQPLTGEDSGMVKPSRRDEGGAIGSAGGKRTTTPTVGSPPSGAKTWIRLPSVFKRITQGLEREGAADVMTRQENPTGKLLGRMMRKHVDVEQELYGQHIKFFNDALANVSKSNSLKAFEEVEQYLRAKENGRPLPTLGAPAQKLVKAWEDIAESTGKIARAHNVQVFDPKTGTHRPMGNLGRAYVPRMFTRDVELVLSDPQRDPAFFNTLAQAIATHKGISLDDAGNELRGVASRFQANDFNANIEMARSEQLPEVFYEYDLRHLAARYLPSFSERMAQIIAYGQRLGPRDAPQRGNLWDAARKETEDSNTQYWLRAAEDQSVNLRQRNSFGRNAVRAQTLANALLLSDPTGTVMRNLTTGAANTAEIFGFTRSLKSVLDAVKEQGRMDAKEIGAVRDNIADFLHSDQLGHDFADDVVRTITDKALKWSGYQGSEVFVRTHAALVASQYVKDTAVSLGKAKPDALGKEAAAMLKRWNIDQSKIVAEKGDWKTGEETRRFIRTAIREMQGGYRFDQVPLWANSAVGRFFYQYGRWGVQRARNLFNNVIKPAIGEEIDWHGKTMRTYNLKPLLRAGAVTVGLGEIFALVAAGLFDRDRKDASLEEIGEAFNEDAKLGFALAAERGLNDILMAGTLGIWGQPIDFAKTLKDQSRLKNPAAPPSLAGLNALLDLWMKSVDQGGRLTQRDWIDFASQVARGPKNVVNVARNIMDEPLYEAQNDVQTLRSAARRWAESANLDVTRGRGEFRKSKNAPTYEPLQEALMIGDANEAKRIADEFVAAQENKKEAREAVRSSVKSRQPFRAGPYYSEEHKSGFMEWAKKNLSKKDANQVRRIQDRYEAAARRAGLWSTERISMTQRP